MARFSSSAITKLFRATPINILSRASSKSSISTASLFLRIAKRAASLTRLARSAPEVPGVARDSFSTSTSPEVGIWRMCILRISVLSFTSGIATTTCLSKRPGLNNAGSRTSGLLVAAKTMTPSFVSNPSISTSI